MKYSRVLFLSAAVGGADAWSQQPQNRREAFQTVAQTSGWIPVVAATFGLAPTTALASDTPTLPEQPTTLISAGAYQAEDSYFSTDLSLPKYNTENSNSLVGIKTPEKVKEAKPAKVKVEKKKPAPPKDETAEQKAAREAKEAKAAAKAEEEAKAKYEKELAIYKRRLADQEKAAAMKAERQARNTRKTTSE